jgi:hypothetical protein
LALTGGEPTHRGPQIRDRNPNSIESLERSVPHIGIRQAPPSALTTEEDVLHGVEIVTEGEILPHHRNSSFQRSADRRLDKDSPVVDLAGIGAIIPDQTPEQGALARPVLPNEGDDLPGVEMQ